MQSDNDNRRMVSDLAKFVDLANGNRDYIRRYGFAAVEAIVREADLVAAVWQDDAEPNGVGFLIVKGAPYLRENIIEANRTKHVTINAVPCVDLKQAYALSLTHGDRRRKTDDLGTG